MTFNEFLNQAWNDHVTSAVDVASRLPDGLKLIETGEQIPQMAALVTHVFGEHLGKWSEGVATLKQLKAVRAFETGTESEHAVNRSIASLELAAGQRSSLGDTSTSDQVRILAVAASALSAQKDADKAQSLFRQALEKAQTGIAKEDPANRALAVTGNNLACALEEQPARTPAETELMILAAQTGRKFWALAGTWLHVERAEYRLAQTYLKAGDTVRALQHAQTCLELSQENDAPALEMFFGYEALALAERARGNTIGFSKALEQMKSTLR